MRKAIKNLIMLDFQMEPKWFVCRSLIFDQQMLVLSEGSFFFYNQAINKFPTSCPHTFHIHFYSFYIELAVFVSFENPILVNFEFHYL